MDAGPEHDLTDLQVQDGLSYVNLHGAVKFSP